MATNCTFTQCSCWQALPQYLPPCTWWWWWWSTGPTCTWCTSLRSLALLASSCKQGSWHIRSCSDLLTFLEISLWNLMNNYIGESGKTHKVLHWLRESFSRFNMHSLGHESQLLCLTVLLNLAVWTETKPTLFLNPFRAESRQQQTVNSAMPGSQILLRMLFRAWTSDGTHAELAPHHTKQHFISLNKLV